jgi:hypothetical protein
MVFITCGYSPHSCPGYEDIHVLKQNKFSETKFTQNEDTFLSIFHCQNGECAINLMFHRIFLTSKERSDNARLLCRA